MLTKPISGKRPFSNQSGVTLVGVVVAAGLLGVLTLFSMQVQINLIGSQETTDNRYAFNNIQSNIRQLLGSPKACRETLEGQIIPNLPNNYLSVSDIRDDTGSATYSQGSSYEGGRVLISKMDLSSFVPSESGSHEGTAELLVFFQSATNVPGTIDAKPRRIALSIKTNLTTRSITKCSALFSEKNDNSWRENVQKDLYFDASYVGIGVENPENELDILGDAKFKGSLNVIGLYDLKTIKVGFSGDCNAGSQRYNTGTDTMEFCNSGSWEAMGSLWSQTDTGNFYTDPAKNVGIGTETPEKKFHVDGNAKFDGYMRMDSSSGSSQALAVQGRVIIGQNLDSSSSIVIPPTLASDDTQFGVDGDVEIEGTLETSTMQISHGSQACNGESIGVTKRSGSGQFKYCDGNNWQVLLPEDVNFVKEEDDEILEVDKIMVGKNHTCTYFTNKKVKCFGKNNKGQLGDNTNNDSGTPVYVEDDGGNHLEDVAAISTHGESDSTCARMVDGTVRCWGANNEGQLGNGSSSDSNHAVAVNDISTATLISVAAKHACVRLSDGTAKCWGANDEGQLGDGTKFQRNTPVLVKDSSGTDNREDITSIETGNDRTCINYEVGGETRSGCWGKDGDQTAPGNTDDSLFSGPVDIAIAGDHICMRPQSGTVQCWGLNQFGQLGDGHTSSDETYRSEPKLVIGITSAVKIAVRNGSSCAILRDKSLWCWGQITNDISSNKAVKVVGFENVVDVRLGYYHNCVTFEDGTGKCWSNDPSSVTNQEGLVSNPDNSISTESETLEIFDHAETVGQFRFRPCGGVIRHKSESTGVVGDRRSCAVGSAFHNDIVDGVCVQSLNCSFDGSGYGRERVCESAQGTCKYTCSNSTWTRKTNNCEKLVTRVHSPDGPPPVWPIQIASGYYHTCVVLNDGTAKCWGRNNKGQLGNGTKDSSSTPVKVSDLTNAVQISVGDNHSCAVLSDGTAKCWGNNEDGQLGDGHTTNRYTPVAVSGLTNAVQIALGEEHTCAVLRDGTAKCWGANSSGQLGDNSLTRRNTAVAVDGITNAVQIALGYTHSCAVLNDGTAKCWGKNNFGQLGDGFTTNRRKPVEVFELTNAAQIALGDFHTCAILTDGTAKCWGRNNYGQLGDSTGTQRNTPVAVLELTNAVQIALGSYHTCAVLRDGTAKCWGYNNRGQLGNGSTTHRSTPGTVPVLTNVLQIALGSAHSCAVLRDGTAKCWGWNAYGQLGNGSTTQRTTPVFVDGFSTPYLFPTEIAGGETHSCALMNDGTAKCWGWNNYGQLGNGTKDSSSTPVKVSDLTNAIQISLGDNHSCAVLSDGTAKCWGYNNKGQLGDNTTADKLTPVKVLGLANAVQIALGGYHTCALLRDGKAKCWGNNNRGQLGDGTTTHRSKPVAVLVLTNAVQIALGENHSCAVLLDGTAKCWGWNKYGQLGNGTGTQRNTPVAVLELTNAIQISLGGYHSCALLRDGTAKCWGRNGNGQLGASTTQTCGTANIPCSSTPVAVDGLTNAVQIALGFHHSCAVLRDGTAKCWGWNAYGQLGNGSTTDRYTPVAVSGLTNAVQISLGDNHSCAVLSDGTAKCWGRNASGRLGDGHTTDRSTPVFVDGTLLNP